MLVCLSIVLIAHASPTGLGAHATTSELGENSHMHNCRNSEPISLDAAGTKTITADHSSSSIATLNEGNGSESQMACIGGSLNEWEHNFYGWEVQKNSFYDYQNTSPFLHQSDSGAARNFEFSQQGCSTSLMKNQSRDSNVTRRAASQQCHDSCKNFCPRNCSLF